MNGTKKHKTLPKGQSSSRSLATLKGILKVVMTISEQARLAINILVVVRIFLLPNATLQTSKLPHSETQTIKV
jgi:hypothetical protein